MFICVLSLTLNYVWPIYLPQSIPNASFPILLIHTQHLLTTTIPINPRIPLLFASSLGCVDAQSFLTNRSPSPIAIRWFRLWTSKWWQCWRRLGAPCAAKSSWAASTAAAASDRRRVASSCATTAGSRCAQVGIRWSERHDPNGAGQQWFAGTPRVCGRSWRGHCRCGQYSHSEYHATCDTITTATTSHVLVPGQAASTRSRSMLKPSPISTKSTNTTHTIRAQFICYCPSLWPYINFFLFCLLFCCCECVLFSVRLSFATPISAGTNSSSSSRQRLSTHALCIYILYNNYSQGNLPFLIP